MDINNILVAQAHLAYRRFVFLISGKKKRSDPAKIALISHYRNSGYCCNPKYIAEEILRRDLPCSLIWIANGNVPGLPPGIRLVNGDLDEKCRELATSRIWVGNGRLSQYFNRGLQKKTDQTYFQTWHGSFGIKKIEQDSNCYSTRRKIHLLNRIDARSTDFFISHSRFESDVVKRALGCAGTVLECGHPRNDIFFRRNETVRAELLEHFGLSAQEKLILYAPTHRDGGRQSLDLCIFSGILAALEKRFQGHWVILVRLHPHERGTLAVTGSKQLSGVFRDAGNYEDMQKLLCGCDAMISDYSSIIFDFMLTRKPAFLYCPDRERYEEERGLYYPLEDTPFPLASTVVELIDNITAFDCDDFGKRVEKFLKAMGSFERGAAAEYVVDVIQHLLLYGEAEQWRSA